MAEILVNAMSILNGNNWGGKCDILSFIYRSICFFLYTNVNKVIDANDFTKTQFVSMYKLR